MKAWYVFLAVLLACVSCHKDDKDEPAPSVAVERLVIIYMMAENSLFPYAQGDLEEIRKGAGSIPSGSKLVVYLDDSDNTEKARILSFDAQEGEKTIHEYDTDPISTDSASMQEILGRITTAFHAQHYGLVMWSHGSGWIPQRHRTIGIDNGRNTISNQGTELETETLARILRNTGIHWDYILFDACFMQCVEVAYQLRHITDWCMGSPAEIPAHGAPYNQIMPELFSPSEECWKIVDKYFNYYGENYGVVLSAVRTSELEGLAAATAPHIRAMEQYPTQDIQTYCTYDISTGWKPEYFDMGSAMGKWLSAEDYAQWFEALDRAVPHRYLPIAWITSYSYVLTPIVSDAEHDVGMSLYVPIEGRDVLNQSFAKTEWHKACGWH